jgi:hypothetical protein
MKRLYLFFFLIVAIWGCATLSVPLPENLQIIPPSSEVPEELRKFSGQWHGQWYQLYSDCLGVQAIWAVEKITEEMVSSVYAWTPASTDLKKHPFRPKVRVIRENDGKVFLTFSGGGNKFRFCKNGDKIKGYCSGKGGEWEVNMVKM